MKQIKNHTKKNILLLKLFFIFFIFSFKFAYSQTLEDSLKIKQVDELLQKMYETNQFNGSVLLVEKGKIWHHKAYGYANFDTKDTMTIHTPVRLASVSKQFTAVCILMLVQDGKLKLDDEIITYLPELESYKDKKITIRHLLRHQSGLPDYFGIDYSILHYYKDYPNTLYNKDLLYYFRDIKPKLHFKPGRRVSYSNTGYVFLALVIERISKMSYHSFVQKNIFDVLGMKDSFVYAIKNTETKIKQDTIVLKTDTIPVSDREIKVETQLKVVTRFINVDKKRAFGYILSSPNPLGFVPLDYHKFDGMVGEKGVCVSTNDFLKWDNGIRKNILVKATLQNEAFIPDDDFGMGWKIYDNEIAYHHGLYRGFRTYMHRNIFEESMLVILNNTQIGNKIVNIIDGIDKILAGKKYKFPTLTYAEKQTLEKFKKDYEIKPKITNNPLPLPKKEEQK
ncbi:MAG: class A beta-lactamase-related serine hydrolase [Bacteroidetes bacterium]|nr:MAG: class A beta-lactamase-related serine hydrolase [Bacteroidota bacterium]TAG86992.1 MAG: class A beta-lactamase-related serine hydrolase [Bacteroidota bacterium]